MATRCSEAVRQLAIVQNRPAATRSADDGTAAARRVVGPVREPLEVPQRKGRLAPAVESQPERLGIETAAGAGRNRQPRLVDRHVLHATRRFVERDVADRSLHPYHSGMDLPSREHRRATLRLDRAAIEAHQLARLNKLLATILPANPLYAHKLAGRPTHLESIHQLAELPFTTKDDLLPGRADGDNLPTNHTFPPRDYVRYHQTSGTRGRPMMVLDTADDWRWWIGCWQYVLDAADVSSDDRVMMAFSFGPFIGFWSAYDAVVARGAMAIPGGGLGSLARLELMWTTKATVLCCTPTYALRLAAVAAEHAFPLAELDVRTILVAGEPGGSVPAMRERIESAFAAKVVDHAGGERGRALGICRRRATGTANPRNRVHRRVPLHGNGRARRVRRACSLGPHATRPDRCAGHSWRAVGVSPPKLQDPR